MATGATDANGIWQYGEDDSNTTFSALLNRLASSTSSTQATQNTRLTNLEASGRVLQVVRGWTTTFAQNNTNVQADTGLSVTITPKSATSTMYIFVTQGGVAKLGTSAGSQLGIALYRGIGQIAVNVGAYTGTNTDLYVGSMALNTADGSGGTSPITYKTKFWNMNVNGVGVIAQAGGSLSNITVIEVV